MEGVTKVFGGVFVAGVVYTVSFAECDLQRRCLACHEAQQIPSELIYRRYLMRYSTPERISDAISRYLKHPFKRDSIMPPQFFLKFPMKIATNYDDETMRRCIDAYIRRFDVKRKLRLR